MRKNIEHFNEEHLLREKAAEKRRRLPKEALSQKAKKADDAPKCKRGRKKANPEEPKAE